MAWFPHGYATVHEPVDDDIIYTHIDPVELMYMVYCVVRLTMTYLGHFPMTLMEQSTDRMCTKLFKLNLGRFDTMIVCSAIMNYILCLHSISYYFVQ